MVAAAAGFSESTTGAGVVLGDERFAPFRYLFKSVYAGGRLVISLSLVDMFTSVGIPGSSERFQEVYLISGGGYSWEKYTVIKGYK